MLIGDSEVGKTSLLRRRFGEWSGEDDIRTIGVDLGYWHVAYNQEAMGLLIFDLAGRPTFEKVRGPYYHGSNGMILVYSVIDRKTFDNAWKWLVEAYKNMKRLPPIVIVGNKIDLRTGDSRPRQVSASEAREFTKQLIRKHDVPVTLVETSAKTGENVMEVFEVLLGMITAQPDSERGR